MDEDGQAGKDWRCKDICWKLTPTPLRLPAVGFWIPPIVLHPMGLPAAPHAHEVYSHLLTFAYAFCFLASHTQTINPESKHGGHFPQWAVS